MEFALAFVASSISLRPYDRLRRARKKISQQKEKSTTKRISQNHTWAFLLLFCKWVDRFSFFVLARLPCPVNWPVQDTKKNEITTWLKQPRGEKTFNMINSIVRALQLPRNCSFISLRSFRVFYFWASGQQREKITSHRRQTTLLMLLGPRRCDYERWWTF